MTDEMRPKDDREAVALFRAQLLGPLLCRGTLERGELAELLRGLADARVRPPGSDITRSYSVPTLERWYYAYRRGGLGALHPERRSDRGHAQQLTVAQRELLLAIRRERPRVSAALILRTLEADGRLDRGQVSESTVRRLFAEHGLDRLGAAQVDQPLRRRWETAAPNALWHADVCHGPMLRVDGEGMPLRIHAILDDHSRYVVALAARSTERESEMLALLVQAMRRHGAPDALYLDNGPTYVGETLSTACGRLGIGLIHAKAYDPQARGKMERFWRTLRDQCLDHLEPSATLHDVQVRLLAWLDRHYLVAPHASLVGKSPAQVYEIAEPKRLEESMLREALTVRGRRLVAQDATLSVAGTLFEVDQSYLCGRKVTVARCLLDPSERPWVEYEDQQLPLRRVDPRANAKRRRQKKKRRGIDAVSFDPNQARLDALLGGDR